MVLLAEAPDNFDDWPQYVSHKVVRAARIVSISINHDSGTRIGVMVDPDPENVALIMRLFMPNEPSMLEHAEIGGYAVVYEDGYRSISPAKAFNEGYEPYKPEASPRLEPLPLLPVLMSADNPDGWKLEELLDQACSELETKNQRLKDNANPVAQGVVRNNLVIIQGLRQAAARQRETLNLLNTAGPDQGPRGKSRLETRQE